MKASVKKFPAPRSPADQHQRSQSVAAGNSILVQAPAGSGKTTLLAERFLRLLPTVEEPEQVLAITFTRAAVAEMRERVLTALRNAQQNIPAKHAGEESMLQAAAVALQWSEQRGWGLLQNPAALNIQTIDGLALTIARQTPLTSRLGPGFAPMDDASSFYKRAALRTLQSLEDIHSADPLRRQTAEAAATLLRHRDNRLQACAALLADMLKNRDQWRRVFPLNADLADELLDKKLRPQLESFLRDAIEDHLQRVGQLLEQRAHLCPELLRLARFAAQTSTNEIAHCHKIAELPSGKLGSLQQWLGLRTLLLTKGGTPRKVHAEIDGFASGSSSKAEKAAVKALAAELCQDENLQVLLHEISGLPSSTYTEDEWHVAKALFRLLHHGALQLKLLFADSGAVDFTEVTLAAIDALTEERGHPTELGFALSSHYRHLLVDEFQDTSRTHHALLEVLLNQWQPGDGRTLFCVGDPMQSIYLFRQAELRLFRKVAEQGLSDVPVEFVKLSVNFRSQSALVEEHNRMFRSIFAAQKDVDFVQSEAFIGATERDPVQWHFIEGGEDAMEKEAETAVELITAAIHGQDAPPIADKTSDKKLRVAILVRAKIHASAILRLLHKRGIAYRATDMESLADRQEVLDVFALTRALLHPADRVAWLSILRGPWCGLTLAALDTLAGSHGSAPLLERMSSLLPQLPLQEQLRTQRVYDVLQAAIENRATERLPALVWQTWRALGGEHCVNAEELANVHAYFALLDAMDASGTPFRCETIDDEIKRLCAKPNPDPLAQVEVLTIHKSKGREFDVVIVPQLHRETFRGFQTAVDWIEDWPEDGDEDHVPLYLAPIKRFGDAKAKLNAWIYKKKRAREHAEVKRLFYVAATRARTSLHLMAALRITDKGLASRRAGTLLEAAWTVAEEHARKQLLGQQKSLFSGVIDDMAASGSTLGTALGVVPVSTLRGLTIQRLNDQWFAAPVALPATALSEPAPTGKTRNVQNYAAGTRLQIDTTSADKSSRIAGTVLHAMLENAARRRSRGESWDTLRGWTARSEPALRQLLLAAGMPASTASGHARSVLSLLQKAVGSENGRWALEAHADAQVEFALDCIVEDRPASVRVDRAFLAGPAALSVGESHRWILDYKSAAPGRQSIPAFLDQQQAAYGPKMALYAAAVRSALPETRPILCALYFPAIDAVHVVAELPAVDSLD